MLQEFMRSLQTPEVMNSLIIYLSGMFSESIDPACVTKSGSELQNEVEFGVDESMPSKQLKTEAIEEYCSVARTGDPVSEDHQYGRSYQPHPSSGHDDSLLLQPYQSSEDLNAEVTRFLDQWPEIEIVQKHLDEESKCKLCQGFYELDGKAIELPCKHFFHSECLQYWLENMYKCPTCSHDLKSEVGSVKSESEQKRDPNRADILGDLVNELFMVY